MLSALSLLKYLQPRHLTASVISIDRLLHTVSATAKDRADTNTFIHLFIHSLVEVHPSYDE